MIDPVAFTLFGLEVKWYGLVYVAGFLLTYYLFIKSDLGIRKEQKEEIFFWLMLSSILVGRLFYVLFYNPVSYISDPLSILYFWEGGMSIHGGLTGAIISIYFLSKRYNINFFRIADFLVVPLSLFLSIGRLANFINQELYGYVINNPALKFLGVRFDMIDNKLRYPTQLFESFKNFLVFYALTFLREAKSLKEGTLTAWFLILYNFLRFFIDFLRVPTGTGNILTQVIGISLGQVFCLIFGIAGVLILITINKPSSTVHQ